MTTKRMIGVLVRLVIGGLAWPMLGSTAAEAAGWTRLNLPPEAQLVSVVAADPQNAANLAVVSGGRLYTSATGGLLWRLEPLEALVSDVAYDPAQSGRLWIGALDRCLMSRRAGEVLWRSYPRSGGCYPVAVTPTATGVYLIDLASPVNEVRRLDLTGHWAKTAYAGGRPYQFAADPAGHHLYVGADAVVSRSDDDGASWRELAKPFASPCCLQSLWADDDELWELAFNRLFRSVDAGLTWSAVGAAAAPADGLRSLIVHGSTPFLGQVPGGDLRQADVVTQPASPVTGLGLGRFPERLVVAGDHLLAATADGLWRYDTALPSAARRQRPVVVIPGVLGSWPKSGTHGELVIDPILHTYDRLLATLRAVGFSETDKTLVPFAYQWRQDNDLSARQLGQLIATVKSACGCASVDLVAHSMGGLVARAYIEGAGYGGDVRRLIEIGTPNQGSPQAYALWEAGQFDHNGRPTSLTDRLLLTLIRAEGALHRYVSLIDYLRTGLPSLGQLLPDYGYVAGRSYPERYPRNRFLEALNSPAAVEQLRHRVRLMVIGSEAEPTLTGLTLAEPSGNHDWPDGRIIGRTLGRGDGAVPLESVAGLGQLSALVKGEHGSLPTTVADLVVRYLLGDEPDAAYLGSIPNQPALARAASAALPASTQRVVIIYAPSEVALTIRDGAGRSVVDSVSGRVAAPERYWLFRDDSSQYLVVTDPAGDSSRLTVTVPRGHGGPIGAIETLPDGSPSGAEVVVGEPDQADQAAIDLRNDRIDVQLTGGVVTGSAGPVVPPPPVSRLTNDSVLTASGSASGAPLTQQTPLLLAVSPPRTAAATPVVAQSIRPAATPTAAQPVQRLAPRRRPLWPLVVAGLWLSLGVIGWLLISRRRRRTDAD